MQLMQRLGELEAVHVVCEREFRLESIEMMRGGCLYD